MPKPTLPKKGKPLFVIKAKPKPVFLSCWDEGAQAARNRKPVTSCPYGPESYDFVTWHNGWSFAKYRMNSPIYKGTK